MIDENDNLIRNQYLSSMGVEVWVSRGELSSNAQFQEIITEENSFPNNDIPKNIIPENINSDEIPTNEIESSNTNIATFTWDELESKVNHCDECELNKNRENSVFGTGNRQANVFIVGSITNAAEDMDAKELVGTEGILLDNMLTTLSILRKDVYISNLVKCKSSNQREFSTPHVEKCFPYLARQIELVNPKMIILFGEQAAQFVLKTNKSMTKLIGNMHDYLDKDCVVVAIEHPEMLLQSATSKRQAWLNLLKIKSVLSTIN